MADNTVLNTGTGGDNIRTEDRGTAKTQIVALDVNPAGTESLMAGSMPVNLGTVATGNLTAVAQTLAVTSLLSQGTAFFAISGTFVGTVVTEYTVDGSTWASLSAYQTGSNLGGVVSSFASPTAVMAMIAPYTGVRIRCTVFTSGTIVARIVTAPTGGVVALGSAIPAGTNGIGNIGTVTTSVTPGTAATNLGKARAGTAGATDTAIPQLAVVRANATTAGTAGNYDLIQIDQLGSQWSHVRQDVLPVQVASAGLTTATTAYTAGDQLGSVMTFAGASFVTGGAGVILDVSITDYSKITGAIELWIFSATPAGIGSDNAAITFTDTTSCVGTIYVPAPSQSALSSVATITNVNLTYTCAATSLFVVMVTQSGHTFFGAATDLKVMLGLQRG